MTALQFTVVALATYRITRLFTADRIMDWARAWAERRSAWLGYLITCDWCLSIWLAPPVAALMVIWGDNRLVLAALFALAASALTGLLSIVEARLDR